jgi:F-type H+-transporting ATPase subunit delta
MEAFHKVCEENRDFYLMLMNPIIPHAKKLKILEALFTNRFHKISNSIFILITKKHREQYLPAIAKQFLVQYNINQGIAEATLTTTFPIDDILKKQFEDVVIEITGQKVELTLKVDKEILGGFVLKIGDRQIDESLSTKLAALRLEFSHNPYVKAY